MMSAALADAAGAGDAPMEGRVQENSSGGSADCGEAVQAPGVRLYEEKEGGPGWQEQRQYRQQGQGASHKCEQL